MSPLSLLLAFASADSVANRFEVQPLARDVYAVIRKDKPGLMVDANNVFIVNERDVIVVDSNGSPAITQEVLKALRKITKKPVRYVINTHYHDDHIRGNSVYRDAFPGVEFIAGDYAPDYLRGQGAANRKDFLKNAPEFLKQLKELRAKKKSLTGADATDEEMSTYDSDISLADLVLKDGEKAETVFPSITVKDRLTIYRGEREIQVLHLGNGHTPADLVVYLPKEKIAITGDLVVWPVPLVGNPQSHIKEWAETLGKLRSLGATTYVPGHGPVLRDDSFISTLQEMFAFISGRVEEGVSRGQSLDEVKKSVDLTAFRDKLAGDSSVRRLLFAIYVRDPAIAAAYAQAKGG